MSATFTHVEFFFFFLRKLFREEKSSVINEKMFCFKKHYSQRFWTLEIKTGQRKMQ